MALNPLLSLQTFQPDTASGIRQFGKDIRQSRLDEQARQREERQLQRQEGQDILAKRKFEQQEKLIDKQIESIDLQNVNTRDKQRIQNNAIAGAQLENILKTGDLEGVKSFLQDRITTGEEKGFDMSDSKVALQQAESGDLEALQLEARGSQKLAEKVGVFKAGKPTERFETLMDAQGNIVAQRNVRTGKVIADPRVPKDPSTVVNINPETGEKRTPVQEAISETDIKGFTEVITAVDDIPESKAKTIQSLNLIKEGAKTGTFAELKILLNQAGLNIKGANDLESIQATSTEEIIPEVKKLGVNPTDFDFKQVKKAKANVGKSPEANVSLLDMRLQILERLEAHATIIREGGEKGLSSGSIKKSLRKYDKENPFEFLDPSEVVIKRKKQSSDTTGFTEEKRTRLKELRAKRDAGKLG